MTAEPRPQIIPKASKELERARARIAELERLCQWYRLFVSRDIESLIDDARALLSSGAAMEPKE